jgi:hypothetical protein
MILVESLGCVLGIVYIKPAWDSSTPRTSRFKPVVSVGLLIILIAISFYLGLGTAE